jgi:cephalosporin-C deacetylase-like acetyl esterase
MTQSRLFVLGLLALAVASGATLKIPSASGPLTIDGKIDERIWQDARVLALRPAGFGAPFPEGGESRIVIRGSYVCVSARLPEPDRLVAFSIGRDPAWGREDLISWRFDIRPAKGRNRMMAVSVNPLGGFRVDFTAPGEVPEGAKRVLAAASNGPQEWTVEAAIPIESLAEIGFVSVERVRVPRPQAPELRWHWPAINERVDFELAPGRGESGAPEFFPAAPKDAAVARTASRPAAGLSAIPGRVWSDQERKALGIEGLLERNLQSRMAEVAQREKRDWQKTRTREDWERFRDPRLAALRASLAPFPKRTPLRAAVTKRADYGDGFVIENLVYESRPHLLVTANLYLPDRIAGRIPAIVLVHSHHAPKTQSELQDMGMTWARLGVAVLVMDQLGAGERVQSNPWPREGYYSRYALGMQLHLAGESLMKWMVWDLMRGIDLLLERPYVDPARIVLIGAVAGGGDPAAVAAALDQRVAAVIPFNFGEAGPEEHYLEGPRQYDFDTAWLGWGSWETTRNLWRSASDQFFPWFICASVAPRRFVYAFEIAWPKGVEHQPAWVRYQKVFELYGRRDHLDQVDGFGPFPGPGECTNVGTFLRKRLYPILKRWFDFPIPPQEYRSPRSEAELMCLTPRMAAERLPKPASEIALEVAVQRLAAARSKLSASAQERRRQLQAALRPKLGDIEPNRQAQVRALWSRDAADSTVEGLVLETEPGLSVPLLLLRPKQASARLPVVIALAQGGKERFLSDRSADLAALLAGGVAVCLADVRGVGETAPDSARGPGSMSLASVELMLGNTMLGAQLKDTRTLFAYLSRRPDIDPKRIALWGHSFAGVNPERILPYESINVRLGPRVLYQAEPLGGLLALLTALYEEEAGAVAVSRGLISYLSVLEDRFCYVPLDAIVPGILEAGDIPDIVAALAPRAVLLEGIVDGRNRTLTAAQAKAGMASAIAAYRDSPSRLMIREAGEEPPLTAWLLREVR